MLLFSCQQQHRQSPPQPLPHKEDSFLIRIVGGQLSNIDSCVYVSYDLESDTSYNTALRWYICENKFGRDSSFPAADLARLVNRPSFAKMILLFFNDDDYKRIYYNGDRQQLPEIANSLLCGCYNSCCMDGFHAIADSLLARDHFNGVGALWGKTDIKKLPSLKAYMDKGSTNFYKQADLAAVFHNTGQYDLRDSCMARAVIAASDKKQYNDLKDLIKKNRTFDRETYNELIYGSPY